jgi:hypothetical protein
MMGRKKAHKAQKKNDLCFFASSAPFRGNNISKPKRASRPRNEDRLSVAFKRLGRGTPPALFPDPRAAREHFDFQT